MFLSEQMIRFVLIALISLFFILSGLISWKGEKPWFHRSYFKRVDQEGYLKYVGIIDFTMGVVWLLFDAFFSVLPDEFLIEKGQSLIVVSFNIYICLIIFGEWRYETVRAMKRKRRKQARRKRKV